MSRRAISPLHLVDIVPSVNIGALPVFELVAPQDLLVDEAYQRELSEKSQSLIRRIVIGFSWDRFKPPIVARNAEGRFEVIDGQHTAIAAASHPDIELIPVMVVAADNVADRARAFVGHNRDRLGITATQLHFSALAAGDPDAMALQQACDGAGVRMLKMPPGNGVFKPRETMAVGAITRLVDQRGPQQAQAVLQVLADADACPISADGIKAIDLLLHEPEYAESVTGEGLTATWVTMGGGLLKEARVFAATHGLPVWRALAVTIFRNTRKKRKG